MKKTLITGSIVGAVLLVGGLTVTNEPLSKLDNKEVIDAVEKGNVVEFAYKGVEVPNKLTMLEVKEKRTDSSYTEKIAEDMYKTRTYSGATFFKDERSGVWHEIEYATTTKTDFDTNLEVPLTRLLSGRVYAATVYSGAGDGNVDSVSAGGWSFAHDDTAGDTADYTSSFLEVVSRDTLGEVSIQRMFLPFNTSSIPSNANISSASLNVYVDSKENTDNDGDDWVNVIQTSQASETTLSTADFDQAGSVNNPTEGATRIDITSVSSSAYNTFTLDSTGRGWIKRSGETANCGASTGWACLGLREGHDAINSAIPTNSANSLLIYMSEFTGTSQDPYLDITYTVPSSSSYSLEIGGSKLEIGGAKLSI